MDDGNKQGSGFHFNTQGFSLEEVQLLSNILISKFELENTTHPRRGASRIYILRRPTESVWITC